MSLIVKGIEMPKNCKDCPCFCEEYFYCQVKESDDVGLENRPKDCPLVPVPPHGDLIERDALKKQGYFFPCAIGVEYAIPLRALREAPTIIPAEEGEV